MYGQGTSNFHTVSKTKTHITFTYISKLVKTKLIDGLEFSRGNSKERKRHDRRQVGTHLGFLSKGEKYQTSVSKNIFFSSNSTPLPLKFDLYGLTLNHFLNCKYVWKCPFLVFIGMCFNRKLIQPYFVFYSL